ncbi:MAG TPA: hypothetical protein VJQ82_24070 [Terriglobales bacterium]|nr:hypothetical protein [Terriglobales bacterium]
MTCARLGELEHSVLRLGFVLPHLDSMPQKPISPFHYHAVLLFEGANYPHRCVRDKNLSLRPQGTVNAYYSQDVVHHRQYQSFVTLGTWQHNDAGIEMRWKLPVIKEIMILRQENSAVAPCRRKDVAVTMAVKT